MTRFVEHAMTDFAFCLPNFAGGGAENSAVSIASGLARRGYSVDMVVLGEDGPFRASVDPAVRVVNLRVTRARYSIPNFVRYLSRERPKVAISILLNGPLALAGILSGTARHVYLSERSLHSASMADATFGARASHILVRMLVARTAGMLSVSRASAEDLVKNAAVPEDKVRVAYNPVVSEAVAARGKEPPTHEWLLEKSAPVVLSVGRLETVKNHAGLIRALAAMESGERPVRLIVLGEGSLRSELERLAAELGISSRVSLPGFVENPQACMAHADVFVLNSDYEGLPGVLIHALAQGLTPVATDSPGGTSEILNDGEFGYLVPLGDVNALARAIEEALKNPLPPEKLRARAWDFSEEASLDAYESLIREAGK